MGTETFVDFIIIIKDVSFDKFYVSVQNIKKSKMLFLSTCRRFPGAPLRYFNGGGGGGGSNRGSYFIPKKSHTSSKLCLLYVTVDFS